MTAVANTNELNSAAIDVENMRNDLTAMLTSLDSHISTVAPSVWGGVAQVAFMGVMARYRDTSAKLHQNLTTIADQLRANGAGYQATEEDSQSQIAGTGNLLDIV